MKSALAALALAASARAGTVVWSGLFNASASAADFDKWSWSNQIQPWQWYIHGPSATSTYLGVSSSFKNPADTSSAQGLRTTIDGTAFWNGQTMERTELIPQTSANLGTGHLYYHFSLKTASTHAPNPNFEHQIAFFESHFTELKYGTLSGASGADNKLRWCIGGQTQWSVDLAPDTWYNFAYDINFSGSTVALWYSTGSGALTQVKGPVSAAPSTNSADWHVGVLRLPNGGTSAAAEDWFWSGVYVESGSLTTSVAGPKAGSAPPGTTDPATSAPGTTAPATTVPATSAPATTAVTTAPPATTSVGGATAAHYAQCGGNGWTGPTACEGSYTCTKMNDYYSQCL